MSTSNRPDGSPDLAFKVTGMMCQQNCAATVQRAISTVKNVEYVEVSFPNEEALVWGKLAVVSDIITEVEDMGYDAELKGDSKHTEEGVNQATSLAAPITPEKNKDENSPDVELNIKGMFDSTTCPQKINSIISVLDGVFNVAIDFEAKKCSVWGFVDVDTIIEALAAEGYGAKNANTTTPHKKRIKANKNTTTSAEGENRIVLNLDKLLRLVSLHTAESALKAIPTVQNISTDVEGRIITVFCTTTDHKVKTLEAILALNYGDSVVKNSALRREYIFEVTGMSCANCAMRVERTLYVLPGITLGDNNNNTNVSVSSMTNKARVLIDESASDAVGPRGIMDAVTKIGYGCTLLSIDGVSISSGESTTENDTLAEWYMPLLVSIILGVPVMVLHLSMSFSETVMMYFDMPVMCSGGITLMQTIMFLLNLPILCVVGYRYYKGAVLGAMHNTYGMDCLVTVGTSITFLYSTIQLGLACGNHIATSHVFFETTGMLLMFVTIGKFIEAYAKRRSFAAISNLLKLQPREALLVVQSDIDYYKESSATDPTTANNTNNTNNTTEVTKLISLDLVQRGDVLKVFPGDRIPTDAYILMGSSFVDESMITGESLPVLKKKGDVLFGSTVNQNNVLYISVTSLGSESALYQIIKLVEAAQMSKAPVQAYADRIAGIFTPIILVLSVLTFVVWCSLSLTHVVPKHWYTEDQNDPFLFSMIFAISVVVISCPCALGLATPTAIMAGTSVGAMNGILIKGGGAFETAHKIDTVIFDKTGTLTEGKPAVTDIVVFAAPKRKGSLSPAQLITTTASSTLTESTDAHALELENNLLVLAATAEQSSDHPLSRAILHAAKDRHLKLFALAEDATVMFVGSGVQCDTGAHGIVLVGNRALMEEQQVALSPQLDATMWDLQIQGKTAICVAVNNVIVGVLGIADTAKEEAYSTIRALHALKIDVWMVTGDNRTTAEALAEELEIPKDRILAGVLPKDKVAKVQELQTQGRYVAMVGDGINDSPALAQAHLGIAIGAGTEVAIEAADMVLIRSHLHDLVVALDLARLVFNRIQVNFVWATIYNILAIPYAAGCWFPYTHLVLPPQYAGLAMALSSVSVVISSMCLWLYRRPLYLVDENALQDKINGGGVLAKARRKLQSLKENLTGRSHNNKESGIAMNILHSNHTSATSLNTMSSGSSGGGSATYKRLASTEMEANVDEFVL
eukprot:gene7845-9354_t